MKIKRSSIIVVIAICLLIFIAAVNRSSLVALLHTYHLLPEPEPLTELYFENHQALPSLLVPGKEESISYTIHNVEYKPMRYDVTITAKTADWEEPMYKNTVDLMHDEYKTATHSFTLSEATRTAVIVSLSTGEKIQLWLDPNNK